MKTQCYDLIGDIHGQHGKLTALLSHLEYNFKTSLEDTNTWRHPEGRKVVFLGDYIDRGPAIREVLHTVREMVLAGDALAIMGNHEYNAIGYATPDGRGGFLRARTPRNGQQHQKTLEQFAGREDEWAEWLEWMKRLPLCLDLGVLRAVHACWDEPRMKHLAGRQLHDAAFLRACHAAGSPEYVASGHALKGPELALPDGALYHDKEGLAHEKVRVRWWAMPRTTARISHLAMPDPYEAEGMADEESVRVLPDYAADAPPVFIGHYWLPPHRVKAPLARNIACLDYSAGLRDHPLVAYRWDGERVLSARKFVTSTL